jgi:hypothetical protein
VLLFNTVLKDYFTQEQTEALVTWVTLNPVSLVLVGLAAYLLIQFVSLKISFAFYKKKDF